MRPEFVNFPVDALIVSGTFESASVDPLAGDTSVGAVTFSVRAVRGCAASVQRHRRGEGAAGLDDLSPQARAVASTPHATNKTNCRFIIRTPVY